MVRKLQYLVAHREAATDVQQEGIHDVFGIVVSGATLRSTCFFLNAKHCVRAVAGKEKIIEKQRKHNRKIYFFFTGALTAFQGQLLLTLPAAILSRSFVLSSVFVFQNASPEALAEV